MHIGEIVTNNTLHRTARAAQLPPPATRADLMAVMGDVNDIDGSGAWPIYHGGQPEDVSGSATVATALFDFAGGTVDLYRGNPSNDANLVVTMSLGFD